VWLCQGDGEVRGEVYVVVLAWVSVIGRARTFPLPVWGQGHGFWTGANGKSPE